LELGGTSTAYDAAYVALAEVLGCELLTADQRLSQAPGPRCPIRLLYWRRPTATRVRARCAARLVLAAMGTPVAVVLRLVERALDEGRIAGQVEMVESGARAL